ncbi:MAG: GNAT family N-acetyltransferase [Parvibaculales bacterium]
MTNQLFMPSGNNPHADISFVDGPVREIRGDMTVRLAADAAEIAAAQKLRYQVFYEEMKATPLGQSGKLRRDVDAFDNVCEHLLLTTTNPEAAISGAPRLDTGETVVGCYRLLRRSVADVAFGFYSAGEYDLDGLLNGVGKGLNFMELGRSCVAPAYRTKQGIDLLWRGLGAMVAHYAIDVMFGCASFAGTQPARLALPLAYLHHHRRAQGPWAVSALPERFVDMDMMPADKICPRTALRAMPAVLRGYLRSGCMIGTGAVIDEPFNTIDVFVLMPVAALSERYMARYGKIA